MASLFQKVERYKLPLKTSEEDAKEEGIRIEALHLKPITHNADGVDTALNATHGLVDFVLEKEGPALIERFPGVELRLQKMEFASERLDSATFDAAAENVARAAATLLPPGHFLCAVLSNLAVSPNIRRGGLGRQLCERCEEAAREWGFNVLPTSMNSLQCPYATSSAPVARSHLAT